MTARHIVPLALAFGTLWVAAVLHARLSAGAEPRMRATGSASLEVQTSDSVPTSPDQLFAYLQAGSYQSFSHESSAHPTGGPHATAVIAYLNGILDPSMSTGTQPHPRGAAAVLELFDGSGAAAGWAVMVKTHEGSKPGDGWFWYSVASITDGNPAVASWREAACLDCHSSGSDYVLSPYPLQ